MFGSRKTQVLLLYLWISERTGRKTSESALKARLESPHVCPCDVVKLQKHGGCVPAMELENVPVPLLLASEEEPPALAPAPSLLCACLPLPDA